MIEIRSFAMSSRRVAGRAAALLLVAGIVLAAPSLARAQCSGGANPPTVSAWPLSVTQGQTATVSWSFGSPNGQCGLTANPANPQWTGSVGPSGSRVVTVNATTYFSASCGGPMVGGGCASVRIVATPPQTITPTPVPTVRPQPNVNPIGSYDVLTCGAAAGWTCDANAFHQPLQVHFYKDAPAGTGSFIGAATANLVREPAVGALCGGNSAHGFSFAIPPSVKDGANHAIYAYAINVDSNGNLAGNNPLLPNSPKSVICPASELLANAGPKQCGLVGQPTRFDGSGSLSTATPPRALTSYSWDFGDALFGTGVRPSHVYSRTGLFNVGLSVGDATGHESNQAFTTARIYSTMGESLIISPPNLTYFSDHVSMMAAAGIVSCANWKPAVQIQLENLIGGEWRVIYTSPLMPDMTTYDVDTDPAATQWRMTAHYYVVSNGVATFGGTRVLTARR
jgi:hypothetical protein